ncbi:MAG: methyltransferase type 11, partial [Planctomycetaceae bacterium]|nr:methyltransferase type 11 [Planctomycetaceae bacterium]
MIPVSELRDPERGEPLELSADGQAVVSATTGKSWPITDGIPRFVSSEHLESFGLQWNRYEVAHDDEDRATFEAKTGLY